MLTFTFNLIYKFQKDNEKSRRRLWLQQNSSKMRKQMNLKTMFMNNWIRMERMIQ